MRLRKLEHKDAKLMLEWMHDIRIIDKMQANFMDMTIEDCKRFIEVAKNESENFHLAIVDDKDTYMGTVSLKHITKVSAEFAIVIRNVAMGKGFAAFGMREMIDIGLRKLGLDYIYWCVSSDNIRAIRFYEKNGYQITDAPINVKVGYGDQQVRDYIWYRKDRSYLNVY